MTGTKFRKIFIKMLEEGVDMDVISRTMDLHLEWEGIADIACLWYEAVESNDEEERAACLADLEDLTEEVEIH